MLCIKCGASLPEGANFCHMCGKSKSNKKENLSSGPMAPVPSINFPAIANALGWPPKIELLLDIMRNKYPPAKPGVLHRRVKPWITSARVTSRWYGLPAAKDCYLPPVNGLFRSFPLSAVRPPGLLLTGAGCILLSFYRFFLLYPHSILCTRTPYCDT